MAQHSKAPSEAEAPYSRPYIPISRPQLGPEEKAAVLEVLDSGSLAQGPRVAAFEESFARIAGTRHAVATSSGTSALHLALLANGVGEGDEVITSPFTFVASANSILFTGARPVFADIDESTFNIDPQHVAAVISPRTKAIMPVHLYGQPCDMEELSSIAEQHGLRIIEDAAQAVGASYRERPVGSFGTAAFSLYATKNVTTAEGGMITTDDDAVAELARLLRNHGMRRRYHYDMLGYNFRLTDVLAAIGLVQLGRLTSFTSRRQANARFLSANLHGVATPAIKQDRTHVWHQYTVLLPAGLDRDGVISRLHDAGVGTGVFYPQGVHRFPHVRKAAGDRDFPVTNRIARSVISLPVHPLLESTDLERIAAAVNAL